MNSVELLQALWNTAPLVFAAWPIQRGRVRRDRGELPELMWLRDEGRQLQGVCKGIAEYFGISVQLVRALALTVALTTAYGWAAYLLLGIACDWHPDDRRTLFRSKLGRWLARRKPAAS